MSLASRANESEYDDTFIGARPTPILACGLYGPIRNTVDVAVMDVEVTVMSMQCFTMSATQYLCTLLLVIFNSNSLKWEK
jgi:hypothetical protein